MPHEFQKKPSPAAEVWGYKPSARGSSLYALTRTTRSNSAISVKTTPTPSVKATPAPAAICKPLIPIATESIGDFVSVLKTEIESRRAAVPQDYSISFAQITFPTSIAPHDILKALDEYDEDRLLKFDIDWVRSYVELRVCMPSMVHERTAGSVSSAVMGQITLRGFQKGVNYKNLGLKQTGSVRIDGDEKSKEPDASFIPRSRMNNVDMLEIPTVVVEVGYKEPMTDLETDAKDWLAMKDDGVLKVNLVILLKAFPTTNRFVAELWNRDASGQPQRSWRKDLKPKDLAVDATTEIPMEIQLAELYDNNIPAFLEGTGPIILDLRDMASDARDAKEMMKQASKRKQAFGNKRGAQKKRKLQEE